MNPPRTINLIDVMHVVRNMRAEDAREVFANRRGEDPDALAMEIMRTWGPLGFVFHHAGRPAAIVGATEMWPGVWCAWLLATDDFPHVALGLTKFVKRGMIPYLVENGAHRCEARSIDGHSQAHRWLRLLGASQEARLRRYGRNGEDFLVFRWDAPDVQ
jgi:hypothetical protein